MPLLASAEYEFAVAPADSEEFGLEFGLEFMEALNARGTPHGPFQTVFELDDVADVVEEYQDLYEVWRAGRDARSRAHALARGTVPQPSRAPRRGHVGPRQRPGARRRTCSTRAGPSGDDSSSSEGDGEPPPPGSTDVDQPTRPKVAL